MSNQQVIGIDYSKVKTAAQIMSENLLLQESLVKAETSRRVETRWDKVGQNNVALGLYTESERQDCINWINAHRIACQTILARPDLLELDITDNALWP